MVKLARQRSRQYSSSQNIVNLQDTGNDPRVTIAQLKTIIIQTRLLYSTLFHFKTLWLFTRNDLKSIVYPESAFGVFCALSGPTLTTNQEPYLLTVLGRLPLAALWLWMNLLIFNISNQLLPHSVLEDSINKPTRPIPSGRISCSQAKSLLLVAIPVVLVASLYLGGLEQSVALMVLTWMYNDLGGADENFFVRNVINTFGLMAYSSGATAVICGPHVFLISETYRWIALVGAIVLTTLQLQDLSDQEGDRARGRKTLPLVIGDWKARITIAISVIFWSLVCPAFWGLATQGFNPPLFLGCFLAFRVLKWRTVSADKLTWKSWCVWMVSLYFLPVIKYNEETLKEFRLKTIMES